MYNHGTSSAFHLTKHVPAQVQQEFAAKLFEKAQQHLDGMGQMEERMQGAQCVHFSKS